MTYTMRKAQEPDPAGTEAGPGERQPSPLSLQGLLGNQGLLSALTNNGLGASLTADACHREVVPGDTLWGISEQVFGDGMAWPDLYERNKPVVGDEPDLIHPGQQIDVCGLDPTVDQHAEQMSQDDLEAKKAKADAALKDRNKDLTMEEYLKILETVEGQYTAPDAAGNKRSSLDFVSAMRARYGYEGGNWDLMIPGAPDLSAPDLDTYPDLKKLYEANADGSLKMTEDADGGKHLVKRQVTLPNGEPIDPGHIFTGIDAVQRPKESVLMAAAGVDNQDGATWSGDVGSAIVNHTKTGQAEGLTTAESFEASASKGDLNADLDGVVLGHKFDPKKGLTEQLKSYYLDPKNPQGYTHRYSQFCDVRGLSTEDQQLTDSAKGEIKKQVDSFAKLFAISKYTTHDSTSDTTKAMNEHFETYLEDGLQNEPALTP